MDLTGPTTKLCLICLKEHHPPGDEISVGDQQGFSLLGKQLQAIFVLRELLRLPSQKLEHFLHRFSGEHPDSWISLCQSCGESVDKAFKIFEELVIVNRKYKRAQEVVVQKLKQSCSDDGPGNDLKEKDCQNAFLEETRAFVKTHDYGPFESPFMVGDWEAEWRVEQQKAVILQDHIKEEDSNESFEGNDTFEELPADRTHEEDEYSSSNSSTSELDTKATSSTSRFRRRNFSTKKTESYPKGQDSSILCPYEGCGSVLKNMGSFKSHKHRLHYGEPEPGKKLSRTRSKRLLDIPGSFMGSNGKVQYRCLEPNCSKLFKHIKHFKQHQLFHTLPEKPWVCNLCQKEFTKEFGLEQHQRKAHGVIRPLQCSKCGKEFQKRQQLWVHCKKQRCPNPEKGRRKKIKRTPEETLALAITAQRYTAKCPHCNLTMNKYHLPVHIKIKHEGSYPIHCEICGVGLSDNYRLRMHQVNNHFICGVPECKLQLGSRLEVHQHQLEVHGEEVDLFKCSKENCNKVFKTREKLNVHTKVHQVHETGSEVGGTGETFICDLCGKTFALQEYLYYHNWHTHRKMRKYSSRSSKNEGKPQGDVLVKEESVGETQE